MRSNTCRLVVGALAVAILATAPLAAAGPRTVSKAVHHDTSLPLLEMHRINAENRSVVPTGINVTIPNHTERTPNALPQGREEVDANVQLDARPDPLLAPTPAPSIVFEGSQDSDNSDLFGFAIVPPDSDGDVGGNVYFQWINLIYEIFDKNSGTSLLGPAPGSDFWIGFGGACQSENGGDPLVLYDHIARRWVVSQFTTSGAGLQCVAVSATSDPLGSYHRYAFQVAGVGNVPDYPKMGVWSDSYLYAQDEFSFSFNNAVVCAFERASMLSGAAADFVCFDLPCLASDCPFGVLPADLEGEAPPAGTKASFFQYWDGAVDGNAFGDGVRNWTLNLDWANPGSATLTDNGVVAGAAWTRDLCGFSRSCVPQLGGESVDTLAAKTMWRAHTRWEGDRQTVLLNSSADVGAERAGVHWAELQNTGSGWSYVQEGTYAPNDGLYRWMASIAKDSSNNICIGYSVSNGSNFPSIRYACRSEGDPLGTLPGGEMILKAGTGSQVSSANRWGDYASLTVDHGAGGCNFWLTSEYYQTTSSFNFHTSIGSFGFPECKGPLAVDITPARAGMMNDWNVSGATPSGGVTVVCLKPAGGAITVGTGTADANGNAVVQRMIPGGAAGRTLTCGVQDNVSGKQALNWASFQ